MDSDEEPPPLFEEELQEEVDERVDPISNQPAPIDAEEPSVMEQLMQQALNAKALKRKQLEQRQKSFGSGLKKGFFNCGKKSSTLTSQTRPENQQAQENKKTVSLRIQQSDPSHKQVESDRFVFPEVQQALNDMNSMDQKDWLNDDLMAKLARDPKLCQALSNPRFSQAIQEMQANPQAAVAKYRNDPDVSVMLRDFMGFLANHFEELGRKQASPEKENQSRQETTCRAPQIVDFQQVQRDAIAKMPHSKEEESQVQAILNKPELLEALGDQKFMHTLQQSTANPQMLGALMKDPVYGPKLRLLLDAKLVQFG